MKVFILFCCLFACFKISIQLRIVSSNSSQEEYSIKSTSERESQDSVTEFNSDSDTDRCYQCLDLHYYGHYFAKQCFPKNIEQGCPHDFCPKWFDCPKNFVKTIPETMQKDVCFFDGLFYPLDSFVETKNPCRQCLCKKVGNNTELICTESECSSVIFEDLKPNCFRKYSKDKCCPELVCDDEKASKIKCEFEEREFNYGDHFSPLNDPCTNCICDEFWNATSSSSILEENCSKTKCLFINKDGCVPIYSPDQCCPLDYHCPKDSGEQEPTCKFGKNSYYIGEKVLSEKKGNLGKCLECTCIVPPEITCTQYDC